MTILKVLKPLSSIVQIASSTVPPGNRFVVGASIPASVAEAQFIQVDNKLVQRPEGLLLAKVLTAGGHATFVATIEGSFDGASWFGLQMAVAPLTGLTIDGNGIGAAAALLLPGAALRIPGGFPFYRIGLAGSAAASGTGIIGLMMRKDD